VGWAHGLWVWPLAGVKGFRRESRVPMSLINSCKSIRDWVICIPAFDNVSQEMMEISLSGPGVSVSSGGRNDG
jgi:hypothetical protein